VHAWREKKMHKGFWWGNPNKREHLEDVGTGERSILEMITLDGRRWTGLILLKRMSRMF